MDYQVVIRTGTSNRKGDNHTNTFNIRTPAAIDSPEIVTAVTAIANAIRPDLVNTAQFLSAKVRDITGLGGGYNPAKVRSIGLGIQGQRLTGGTAVELKLVTMNYRLTGLTGRPGGVKLRLLVMDNEVNGGANGNLQPTGDFVDHAGLAGRLSAAAGTGAFTWLIVNKKQGQPAVGREASTWTFAGPGTRSTTAHRRKKKDPKTAAGFATTAIDTLLGIISLPHMAANIDEVMELPAGTALETALSALVLPARGALTAARALKALT